MLLYIGVLDAPLAQTVEHLTFNQGVRSSNLRWSTTQKTLSFDRAFCFKISGTDREGHIFVKNREELLAFLNEAIEPFRIAGNVYFVGMRPASSHLIDTGDGLILIDTGYMDGLHLLINSIYKLGFRPENVKYIINTHWHWDHAEASGALAKLTGAKNLIGCEDAENVKRYCEPDIIIHDGDTLTLGNTTVHFMETPGHTKGTVSLFFDTVDNEKTYRVGMFGGAGTNTLSRGNYEYDGCVDDYLASVERLQKERVDVFIGNHVWNNRTEEKAAHLMKTGENLFFDEKIWHDFLTGCTANMLKIIEEEKNA